MTREEKNHLIDELKEKLDKSNVIYLSDVSCLSAADSNHLRRQCFQKNISLQVVKNTLLKKAIDKLENKDLSAFNSLLEGNTSLMIADVANAPAKLIKNFRKKHDRPLLKGVYIDSSFYIGDEHLDALASLKSKEELIADVIMLLQSPVKNVISALNSSRTFIAGILKTLEEKPIAASEKVQGKVKDQAAGQKPDENAETSGSGDEKNAKTEDKTKNQ